MEGLRLESGDGLGAEGVRQNLSRGVRAVSAPSDPLYHLPSLEQVRRLAAASGQSEAEAAAALLRQNRMALERSHSDPYRHGWEPPIWWVADALLDFPVCAEWVRRYLAAVLHEPPELVWDVWRRRLREALGFPRPVSYLLISGANRASKSEYAAKRGQMLATEFDDRRVVFFHMLLERSIQDQQPLVWRYMPPEWRGEDVRTRETYIAYKEATGFSERRFINPRGSTVMFRMYAQDKARALEGLEADLACPDELIPLDWLETLFYRLASRSGRLVLTFTPIDGYTPAVALFQEDMRVVRWAPGYVLPRDGGPPLPWAAAGLSREEYAEIEAARLDKRAPCAPLARPEDCTAWLEGWQSGLSPSEAGRVGDRLFEAVPRVARCRDDNKAVLWFHPADNPYGNPLEVISRAVHSGRGSDEIRCRVYGIAVKTRSPAFVRFDERVHVIPDAQVPAAGVNYCFCDPAFQRNWFLLWIRSTPEADYVYREWPGGYAIPGVGVPGPWARTSGRHQGRNDGERDEGQADFGFGLDRYKIEIARLEGWGVFRAWQRRLCGEACAFDDWPEGRWPESADLETWRDGDGAAERIEARYIDSRAASQPRRERDRPTTLYEQLTDMGMRWSLAPGDDIGEGLTMIANALDWQRDEQTPGALSRKPRLYVAESCRNLRFAMATYIGADKQQGATKDPIDCLRYFYQARLALCAGAPRAVMLSLPRASAGGHVSRLPAPRPPAAAAETVSRPRLRIRAGGVWVRRR